MKSETARLTGLAIGMLLTALVYWVGLHGPFVLDDPHALAVVRDWLKGEYTLADVLFGNGSVATNRALAMGAFAATAKVFGYDPFGFKLVNLLLHLGTASAAFVLFRKLLKRDPSFGHAGFVALAVTIVWLLHPLHASTVLYAVQQMAQWAALFSLIGLLLYVWLREQMLQQVSYRAWPILFIAIPLITLIGIQGKQNAALIPALCLVVELAYFRSPATKWPTSLKLFFAAFAIAPAVAVVSVAAFNPDILPGEYGLYEFSPWQRLISEARVLCDYIGQILLPNTPQMGVFTDGYPPSRSLFSPWSTIVAILVLIAASLIACVVRKSRPSIFAGWFFFLVAHSVESSVLPLELYYEHRNYLPSFGILLVAASAFSLVGGWLDAKGIRATRIAVVAGLVLVIALAVLTHGRAKVWSDALVLYEAELRSHPDSAYALITYAGTASAVGDAARAYEVLDNAIKTSPSRRLRGQALLFRAHLDCINRGSARLVDLREALRQLPPHIDITTFNLLNLLGDRVGTAECGEITKLELAKALQEITERSVGQKDDVLAKIALRNNASRLFSVSGDWDEAMRLAKLGWQASTPPSAAAVLVEAHLIDGNPRAAQGIIDEASHRARGNRRTLATLFQLQGLKDEEVRFPGSMRLRAENIVSGERSVSEPESENSLRR
jgi:tetratricopeptide (TPR) repeat protein